MTIAKHDLPDSQRNPWPELARAYTRARAAMDLAYANEDDDREDRSEAHTAALDAILLMPAVDLADLRLKIEIMDREDVGDGWWCAQEALPLAAIDARRLLPFYRGEVAQ